MNYVDAAQKAISELYQNGKNNEAKITTSQIRGLLSGISDIYNDIVQLDTNELTPEIKSKIMYLKVQFVYASGRDEKVRKFIEKTNMIKHIDNALNGKKEFIKMERYMEALVAYHKFYGGDE
jgi:CRISPR-associated protein Csm2